MSIYHHLGLIFEIYLKMTFDLEGLLQKEQQFSRATMTKIEKGDDGVSLGAYAKILFVRNERLVELADPTFDIIVWD